MNASDLQTVLIGRTVTAPSDLVGARVTEAHLEDYGPAWAHSVWLVLDRPHPRCPGQFIAVDLDDVILDGAQA